MADAAPFGWGAAPAASYDIDDPAWPLYGQRHGGSFMTGLLDAFRSGATLPGDVATGRAPMGLPSQTEDFTRVGDLAGLAMTGGLGRGLNRSEPQA